MTETMIMVAGVPLPLSGLLIVLFTVLGVVAFAAFCIFTCWLLDRVTAFGTDPKTATWKKIVILIPWILLTIWYAFLALITLGMAIHIATGVRDWWHKGN